MAMMQIRTRRVHRDTSKLREKLCVGVLAAVISTGSIKGQRRLRAQRAKHQVNILLGDCALSPPHITYLFVCWCVCLFVCECVREAGAKNARAFE